MEEAHKLLSLVPLLGEGEHEAADVLEQLLGAHIIHVLLEHRDYLCHNALDLAIQLLGVYTWVLQNT